MPFLSIPIPPVAEQTRIVAEVERQFSLLGATEGWINANLIRAEHLRRSIFSGEFSRGFGESASYAVSVVQEAR